MSEGRLMHVLLLNEQKLEIVVQPKLFASELHDLAASHLRLKEKDYFGLTYRDETGHYQWLQLDRRVLEHEFPRRSGPLVLYFQVRLYIESITYLRDSVTVNLFYLQAIQSLYKGSLECDSETVFELAAYMLQVTHGDYTEDATARMQMKKLTLLSTNVLRQHPSLGYCEDQVIEFYKTLSGHTVGSATVNYMSIVESLPTYGVHYYEVKDKAGIPWWLGISFRGVSVYDHADRKIPRKTFPWKQLENLYFREKKFSIEVVDLKKNTSGSVAVNVHTWMSSTSQLAKCIWMMTVSQHQFYLNRKHRKSVSGPVRSLSDIAEDINKTIAELENSDKMTGTEVVEPDLISSSSQFTSSKPDLKKVKELEALDLLRVAQQQEKYLALKAHKEELQKELMAKISRLRELCLKEAELTGVVPPELPLTPGESLPRVRKRIGTTFVLSPKFLHSDSSNEKDQLVTLEMEFEIQNKIMEAEVQLAQDKSLPKSARKKHRRTYRQEYRKLKELEGKINAYREQAGKERVVIAVNSLDDLSEDSREFLDDDVELDASPSPVQAPTSVDSESKPTKLVHNYYRRYTHHELTRPLLRCPSSTSKDDQDERSPRFYSPEGSMVWSTSLCDEPSSAAIKIYPKKVVRSSPSPRSSPCRVDSSLSTPVPSKVYGDGCSTSSAQSSECQYQTHLFSTRRKQSSSSIGSDFTNSCSSSMSSLQQNSISERDENLYNINTYWTGCCESGDELLNPSNNSVEAVSSDGCQAWSTKHGSLDRRQCAASRFEGNCLSGSLELPELASSKFGSKRDDTIDHLGISGLCEDSESSNGKLSRRNCSERLHHRRRENQSEQATASGGSKGIPASNMYHVSESVDSDDPYGTLESRLRQQAAPVLYVASLMGEQFDTQKLFEGSCVSHEDVMHTPQRVMSATNRFNGSLSTAGEKCFGKSTCNEMWMQDPEYEVLDNPEKLAKFRKERYGRCATGSGKTLPTSSRNQDAVDALFKHHEVSLSFPTSPLSGVHVVSSDSSSALSQSSEFS